MPGLLEELMGTVSLNVEPELEDLIFLQQAFKDWFLERLLGGDVYLIQQGSDRIQSCNPAGA